MKKILIAIGLAFGFYSPPEIYAVEFGPQPVANANIAPASVDASTGTFDVLGAAVTTLGIGGGTTTVKSDITVNATLEASTVTAHVLEVLGPATLNTQGSSTTIKGILLVDGSDVILPNGTIGTAEIANLAVDSSKIAALAVDSEKIALGAIQKGQLAVGAVETDRIASGAVNTGKIANGAVQTQKLNDDAVDTKKLMYTAHRVQSLGVGDGAITIGPDALTVQGTSALRGAMTVAGSSLTVGGSVRVNAGNGNQLLLNNAGEQFTQIDLANNGTVRGSVWHDNTAAAMVVQGAAGRSVKLHPNGAGSAVLTVDDSGTSVTLIGSSVTVQRGAVFGTGAWPTASIGQSGSRVGAFSSTEDGILATANMQSGVAANRGGFLYLGARATTGTDNQATVQVIGAKENATSGNFASYFAVRTSNASETLTEALRIDSAQNIGIGTTSPGTKLHMSSGTLTVDGTNALIKIGDAAATPTAGQMIASPPAAQTIGAGGIIAADACGGVKIVTAAGAVTTDITNTITAPAAANAGCCMDVVNTGATNTITLDQNANNNLAADTALGPCDTIRACSTGASGRWYFGAVFAGTCN